MSTIIEALKKAQKEEAIKKERNADRVIWVPTQKHSRWILPLGVSFCFVTLSIIFFWLFFSNTPSVIQSDGKTTTQGQSITKAASDKPEFNLSGIMWDNKEPIALINSLALKQGETIQGSKVISIHSKSVDLSSDGKIWTLTLEQTQ